MKRLAGFTVVVLATLSVLWLLWQLHGLVLLFLLSLITAAVIRPLIERLVERGLPEAVSLLLTYLLTLSVLGVLLYVVSEPALIELQELSDALILGYERLVSQWSQSSGFRQAVAGQLPPPAELYQAIAGEQGQGILKGLLGVTFGVFDVLAQFLIVLLLSIYWSAERVRIERLWLSLLPADSRTRARKIWHSIEAEVGAYVRSEMLQSLLAGILLGLAYWALGLEYPVILAMMAALAWLVPWVGVLLAIVPVLLVGIMMNGLIVASSAGLITLGVLVFLEVAVEPRLVIRRGYSSLLVVLVMLALADLYGLVGLLLALPLSAAIQITLSTLLGAPAPAAEVEPEHRLAELRARLETVRSMMGALEEPAAPELASFLERSSRLVEETRLALLPPPDFSSAGFAPPASGQ